MTEQQPYRVEISYDNHITIHAFETLKPASEKFMELHDNDRQFTQLWFFAYNIKLMGFDRTNTESNQ